MSIRAVNVGTFKEILEKFVTERRASNIDALENKMHGNFSQRYNRERKEKRTGIRVLFIIVT